jgi:hypothetical protein
MNRFQICFQFNVRHYIMVPGIEGVFRSFAANGTRAPLEVIAAGVWRGLQHKVQVGPSGLFNDARRVVD